MHPPPLDCFWVISVVWLDWKNRLNVFKGWVFLSWGVQPSPDFLRRSLDGACFAQLILYQRQLHSNTLPEGGIIKIFLDFEVKAVRAEFSLVELWYDLFSSNQIDKAIKRNVDHVLTDDPSQIGNLKHRNERSA